MVGGEANQWAATTASGGGGGGGGGGGSNSGGGGDLFNRAVRDHVKAGTCFICTEADPNIATLCCGQALHFHCMSKWFLDPNRDKCPYCRAAVQTCPEATNQAVTAASDEPQALLVQFLQCNFCNNPAAMDCDNGACGRCCVQHLAGMPCARHGTMDQSIDENPPDDAVHDAHVYQQHDDYSEHSVRDGDYDYTNGFNAQDYGDEESQHYTIMTEYEYDGAATTEQQPQSSGGGTIEYCCYCDRRAALDCVHSACKICCDCYGQSHCPRHDDGGGGVDYHSPFAGNDNDSDYLVCFGCTNRAAHECSNGGCARCCTHDGALTCDRHGT